MGSSRNYYGCSCHACRTESVSKCKGCVCDLLRQLNMDDEHNKKLLILTKGASQPISVDGMDPTVFTFEYFDPHTCCATFQFKKEDIDSSVGVTSVKGSFTVDCRELAGLFFLKKGNFYNMND